MPSASTRPRREGRNGAARLGQDRPSSCRYCNEKVGDVDFADVSALRRAVSEKGRIRARRITGTCRRHQNQVGVAVKRAREMALLPYANS
jgi:small subunit ribosomal protein S18